MKIAITAASGQLGAAIARQLSSQIGLDQVVAIARTPQNVQIPGLEVRKGDYDSPTDFELALQGMDAVLIVSGNAKPDLRIQQHRNIIEAAQKNGLKKIVYTSIFGKNDGNAFSPIVASNRQTEEDVRNSGLDWAIGRNGIYIEPDLEYVETYRKEGEIVNCAGEGKCGYTSRAELAVAYSRLLLDDDLVGKTYNMLGPLTTQNELAEAIGRHYGFPLTFRNVDPETYKKERQAALGEFMGTVIAGIYEGIRTGNNSGESHMEYILKRPHHSLDEMIEAYRKNHS